MLSIFAQLWEKLNRRKTLQDDIMETPLKRCLNTFDLTLLGIGHMVGAGIFVLTGTVVKDEAGPAAVLSYLFAGVGALLSSLCYAEFGAKVPKAGSAYTYTYVTIGEFWAFIIGWNIILEHLLGVASVARAFSGSFDALFDGAIKNGTLKHIGEMHVPWISSYLDFIAFLSVLVVMVFIASGARISITVNSIFTLINLLVILLIISVGLGFAKGDNWSNPDTGGFLPFGFPGVFAGAATCFYAYIGFEGIAVAGEEAKNPAKSIPIATCLAMTIVTLLYMGSSAALTLMMPFTETDVAAPFPHAFAYRGLNWAKYVIAIGALFGIITSLLGGLFSMPRAVYSMAADGLLFRGLSHVHPRTQTPVVSIVIFGTISAVLALLIDIEVLVEFLSIGTLMSFTMVAASVIILRYQPASTCQFKLKPESEAPTPGDPPPNTSDKQSMLKQSQSHDDIGKLKAKFRELPILRNLSPEFTTTAAVCIMAVFMFGFALLALVGYDHVKEAAWWAVILLIILSSGIVACFSILILHEQNESFLTFQIPCVPLLPAISMLFNLCMMIKLSPYTWIRLAIWLALVELLELLRTAAIVVGVLSFVGFVIYFLYGLRNSSENRPLSAYSQVLSYGGNDASGPSQGLDEKIHMPQPPEGPARPEPLPEEDAKDHS